MIYNIQYVNEESKSLLKGASMEFNSPLTLLILPVLEQANIKVGNGVSYIGMYDYMYPLIRSGEGDR